MTRPVSDQKRTADADAANTAGHAGFSLPRFLSRPAVAAALVPLGLIAAVALLVLSGIALARTDTFRDFHNHYWLWALGGLHAHRWMLAVSLPATWWLITRLDRRNVGPRRRWAGRLLGAGLLVITAAFTTAWLVSPYGLSREAPLVGTLLLGTLIYLILKIIWADLPILYNWYRRPLRRYLDLAPRGEAWFSIQESFHILDGPTFLTRGDSAAPTAEADQTGMTSRKLPNQAAQDGSDQTLPRTLLDRVSPLLAAGSGTPPVGRLSRLLRCVVPSIPGVLADHDPLLHHELQERAEFWRHRLETALWGDQQTSFLSADAQAEARLAFRNLVASTDALAECHVFGLPEYPSPDSGEQGRADTARIEAAAPHLRQAVMLYAGLVRRCLEPTFRLVNENTPFILLPERHLCELTAALLEREIHCLELLAGEPTVAGRHRNLQYVAMVWKRLRGGRSSAVSQLLAVRFVATHFLHDALRHRATGQARTLVPQPEVWEWLDRGARQSTRLLWSRNARNTATGDELDFALDCRARFLETCFAEDSPQSEILRRHIAEAANQWAGIGAHNALHQYDLMLVAQLDDDKALQSTGSVREKVQERSLQNYHAAAHPANAHLQTRWQCRFPDLSDAVRTLLRRVVREAPSPVSPATTAPDPRQIRTAARGRWMLHRQPNWFGRIPLMILSTAATLLLGVGLWFTRNPPVIAAPDFELAAVPPLAMIHAVAPGIEADPSLWVAMPTGVRVKAPGENFYWQQITSADGRLMSDDVRRVAVGTEHVAYLCAINDQQMGISISSAPSAPPGVWPDLGLTDWRTLIGVNSFGQITDADITTVRQPPGSGAVIFGTRHDRLGAYEVKRRRWLDTAALNSALPDEAGAILDLAVLPAGHSSLLAVATANGIAWGPWTESDRSSVAGDGWQSVPGERLMTAAIPELHWVPTGDDRPSLAFRSAGGGLGMIPADAPQADSHRVLISEDRVPGLTEAVLARLAYDPSARRLWMEQTAGPQHPPRIVVYREDGHRLQATGFPPAGSRLTDLVTDTAVPGSAFAGTTSGLWQLHDSQEAAPPQPVSLGLESSRIQRIAPAGNAGLGVVAVERQQADPSLAAGSILNLHAPGTPAMKWTTILGRRRFPGLAADRITTVVGSTGGEGYFLGTREGGVARVEPATREIFAPFGDATADSDRHDELQQVRDLALIPQPRPDLPDGNRGVDRWLLQVSEDGSVDRIDLRDPRQWQPLLGTPVGALTPEQLQAAKAFRGELFLGTTEQISSYDMSARGWRARPPVAGLADLFVADDTLWALSREGNRDTLLTLTQAPPDAAEPEVNRADNRPNGGGGPARIPEQWRKRFEAVRAFDHTADQVAVITLGGALETAGAGPGSTPIVAPKFLPAGDDAPTLATLRGELLYVTPVVGGIGRYHRGTRQWDTIALPEIVEAGKVTRLHANATGLWLVDDRRQLHLNRYQPATEELAGWTVWAEQVAAVDWSETGTVVLSESGEVRQITAAGETLLVGPGFDADVMADTAAVTEFDGILCVAVGDRIGHYRLADHLWYESRPEAGAVIRRLLTTEDFLYALTGNGRLLRTSTLATPEWTAINPLLTTSADLPDVRFHRPGREQPDAGFPRDDLTISHAVSLKSALGLLVPGLGAFVISDKSPTTPVWIRAQSLGLPAEAHITCAAELDGDLILGTRAHGVWVYQRLVADGITLPDVWLPLPPLENPATPIRSLVTIADQTDALGILTESAAFLLRRKPDRTWGPGQRLNRFTPTQLAADTRGLLLCEAEQGGATWLRAVDLSGNLTTLIGAPVPQPGKATERIAFDLGSSLLYRLDDTGRIAAYDERAHAWHDASVTAPAARIRELFFSAGELRAWSPTTGQLFEYSGRQWQLTEDSRRQSAITQLQWDAEAMVVRRDSEGVELIEAARRRTLLPAAAREFPADWKQVTHLAELGPWLIASARGHGLFAYHQAEHFWQHLSDESADECEIATLAKDGQPASYFLRMGGKLQRLIVTGGAAPRLLPAPLPDGELARSLHRFGEAVVARTASGRLWQPSPDGSPARLRLSPRGLPETKIPTLQAATEFGGHLLVGYPGRQSGVIGIYNPDRLQWQRMEISEGIVRRFLRIRDGNQPRLFAEVERPARAGEAATRQLIALLPQLPGRDWQYAAIDGALLDLAADDRSIWSVADDHRIQRLSVAALRWQPAGLEAGDTAPAAMESAHVIGDTIIALLSDQTVWHYSLADLRWHRHLPDRNVTTLVVGSDEVFAIEKSTGAFHHYNRTRRTWDALPAKGFGKTIVLNGPPADTPAAPQWKITQEKGQPVITWRPGSASDDESPHAVRLEKLRFDFNSYRRIEIRDGTLWAQTLASRDRQPVVRKFSLQQPESPVETAVGDNRFRIPADEAATALAERTSLALTGERFSIDPRTEAESGTWPAIDSVDGMPRHCRFLLHQLGRKADQSTDIAPLLDGERGLVFGIDHWRAIAASGRQLAAATQAGLLTFNLDENVPAITRRVFLASSMAAGRLAVGNGELLARGTGADAKYHAISADESAWRPLAGERRTAAERAFADADSIRDSRRFLSRWEVVRWNEPKPDEPDDGEADSRREESDSRLLRVISVQPRRAVPVTLGRGGFGFDQWTGIELTSTSIRGYTPDGRVTLPRKPQPVRDMSSWQIEPEFAVVAGLAGRVVEDPADDSLVLLGGTGAGQQAWRYREGRWTRLDAPQLVQLLARLGETLHDGDGWTWKADDGITWSRPPFEKQPLAARFNTETGQFSFDAVRAVRRIGTSTWLATDAGLLAWKNGGLSGESPLRLAANDQAVRAEFVLAHDGTTYVDLQQGDAAARLFQLTTEWTSAETAEDRQAVKTAREWLLHGSGWQLQEAEANPDEDAERADRRFLRPTGAEPAQSHPATLTANGRWSFEQLTAIAGTDTAPLLGSPDGCHRLTDLKAPGNIRWLPTPVRSGVTHLLQDGESLQVVHDDDTEIEYDLRTYARRGRAKLPYADRLRRLWSAARWHWERTPADTLEITFRPAPMADPIAVRFGNSRFDFDDVRDIGALPQDSLLATAGGFLTRPVMKDRTAEVHLQTALPAISPKDRPQIFPLYWQEQRRTLVEHPAGRVFAWSVDGWEQFDEDVSAAVLTERGRQVARDAHWNILRAAESLSFSATVDDGQPQPVQFSAGLGGFRCDSFRDVLIVPLGKSMRYLVATAGGLCFYTPQKRLEELTADLTGDGVPDGILNAWRTGRGPLIETRANGESVFLLHEVPPAAGPDKPPAPIEKPWTPIPEDKARELLDEARSTVDRNPQGWSVARTLVTPIGPAAFRFAWQEEPVTLADGDTVRFRHDQIESVAWHEGELWLTSAGGVSRLAIDAASGKIRPTMGRSLWVRPFLSPQSAEAGVPDGRLFSIRSQTHEGAAHLTARVWRGDRSHRWSHDPGQQVWQPVLMPEENEALPEPAMPPGDVLHDQRRLGQWRLVAPGRVVLAPDPDRFHLPDAGPAGEMSWPLFSGGTFSFWDIGPSLEADGEALAWHTAAEQAGWWIATAGGLLRLDPQSRLPVRLYARSLSGAPLTDITHVNLDTQTGAIHAVATQPTRRVIRYRPEADGWEIVETAYPDRNQPVQSAWLDFRRDDRGSLTAHFRPELTDVPRGSIPGSIFADGRFRFDAVRSFAVGDGYWLLTPMGIVRLDDRGDITGHQAAAFADRSADLDRLIMQDGSRYLVDRHGSVWREDGETWKRSEVSPTLLRQITRVAENPLFVCRSLGGRRWEFTMHQGDLPRFVPGVSRPQLLQDGRFGFDDLRDMRLDGGTLLVATRLGIWHYDLARRQDATIPVDANYLASVSGAEDRIPMIDLHQFLPLPDRTELVVSARTGRSLFGRSSAGWQQLPAEWGDPDVATQRKFTVGGRELHLRYEAGAWMLAERSADGSPRELWSEAVNPGDEPLLQDVVRSGSSLWLPLRSRLLWIRTDRL